MYTKRLLYPDTTLGLVDATPYRSMSQVLTNPSTALVTCSLLKLSGLTTHMELQEQAPSVAKGLSIRDLDSGAQVKQPGPPLMAGKAQAQARKDPPGSGEVAGSTPLGAAGGSTPLEEAGGSTPLDEEPRQEPRGGEPGSEAAGQAEARRPAAEEEGEP